MSERRNNAVMHFITFTPSSIVQNKPLIRFAYIMVMNVKSPISMMYANIIEDLGINANINSKIKYCREKKKCIFCVMLILIF